MNARVGIRQAKLNDLVALIEVDSVVATEPARADAIRGWITSGTCFVALIKGQPAGYSVLNDHFFGQAFLEMLMIASAWRGRGIGQALVEHAMTACRKPTLWTTTNQSNLTMQKLLDRLGFIKSGIIEGLDEGDPELVFRIMVAAR